MKIQVIKVPQYSAKSVYVIMVDDKPFCTCRGKKTVSKIISALNGYDVKLDDGRLLKKIKELKNEKVNDFNSSFYVTTNRMQP